MRRDFVFFVNGGPDELLIRDGHYFFAPVADDISRQVIELSKRYRDLQHWLTKNKGKFSVAGFRNDCGEEREAFQDAYRRLSGILDGYSCLTEGNLIRADAVRGLL